MTDKRKDEMPKYILDDDGDYEWVVDPETGEGMCPQKICDLLNSISPPVPNTDKIPTADKISMTPEQFGAWLKVIAPVPPVPDDVAEAAYTEPLEGWVVPAMPETITIYMSDRAQYGDYHNFHPTLEKHERCYNSATYTIRAASTPSAVAPYMPTSEEFMRHLSMMWKEYAECADDNLSLDGQKLKKALKKICTSTAEVEEFDKLHDFASNNVTDLEMQVMTMEALRDGDKKLLQGAYDEVQALRLALELIIASDGSPKTIQILATDALKQTHTGGK